MSEEREWSVAEGLRQQAEWIDDSRDGKGSVYERITMDDIDTDELRDAATEIDSLRAQLATARDLLVDASFRLPDDVRITLFLAHTDEANHE